VVSDRVERKLAAILAADIAGYSRLMGADEEGVVARLKTLRRELIDPKIKEHRGHIVKTTGDGILIEFPSVVEAVRCAVAVQQGMVERNADMPQEKRIEFRVGINLGDIIIERGDIYGDGVNVAARLEGLAEPGGVCISGTVHEQIRDKLPYPFEDQGEQSVKNIARPVHVYRLRASAVAELPTALVQAHARLPGGRAYFLVGTLAVVLLIGAAAAWWLWPSSHAPVSPIPAASSASPATPVAPAPRLSIVVLPFSNLSSDPDQEYFADGITDDLTTDLSRISGSFVIARNTAFTFKGKIVDVKQIGRELGVRYVLEGSVRRDGDKVRINAQLVDAETGAHVWADRFDKDRADIFQMQNEVTGRIADTLHLELIRAESERAQREHADNPDAVDLAMRGWAAINRPLSREQLAEARKLFEQALRINPQSPDALLGLAQTLVYAITYRWSDAPAEDLARADQAVTQVLSTSPDDAMARFTKGDILRARGQFEPAIAEFETAIAIDRNLAAAYGLIGSIEIRVGRSEEAFAPLETAIRLSPRDPLLNIWYFYICHAHTHLGQLDEAITWCRKSIAISPFWIAYIDLISAYGWKGRTEEARAAIAELNKLMPNYTVTRWANEGFSDNPIFLAQYQRIVEGLRKAGLPEQ
jgi:adenylate cyclase